MARTDQPLTALHKSSVVNGGLWFLLLMRGIEKRAPGVCDWASGNSKRANVHFHRLLGIDFLRIKRSRNIKHYEFKMHAVMSLSA